MSKKEINDPRRQRIMKTEAEAQWEIDDIRAKIEEDNKRMDETYNRPTEKYKELNERVLQHVIDEKIAKVKKEEERIF